MKKLFLLLVFIPLLSFAKSPLKVMNFNTMCIFCSNKKDHGTYKERMKGIADTINRHNPDIISLQEFVLTYEVKKFMKRLKKNYQVIYLKRNGMRFVDPVLLIDPKRFELIDEDSFWLGKNPRFPIGWKIAFPRRLQWAQLYDKIRNESFIFVGTHFDNNSANKTPSAELVNHYLQRFNLPILFAGDTNLEPAMKGYDLLLQNLFVNTFPGLEKMKFYKNADFKLSEGCAGQNPNQIFPDCRIDHVLTSHNSPWKVKSWGIDLFRYHGRKGFASDHRAVIVELE